MVGEYQAVQVTCSADFSLKTKVDENGDVFTTKLVYDRFNKPSRKTPTNMPDSIKLLQMQHYERDAYLGELKIEKLPSGELVCMSACFQKKEMEAGVSLDNPPERRCTCFKIGKEKNITKY